MHTNGILVQVNSFGMGSGDRELGLQLIGKYFELQTQEEEVPSFVVFYNEGIKLLTTSSPALDALKKLEQKGTKLIACSTCLNHYQLTEELQVGLSGGMADIIALQTKATKVINL